MIAIEQKTSVIIVGAGPTGLMMAAQLALQNIPFLIIEKASGSTTQSRALGIQARTLEIFAQMGIINEFLAQGQPAKALNFITHGKVARHVPLKNMGAGLTSFPYLLMLEQSKTERILVNFLKSFKKEIYWNTELVSFTQDSAAVSAIVKDAEGNQQTIHADWIIGADGAHSVVRHVLGIKLAGRTYKQSLFVLDCKIDWDMPNDELAVSFSEKSFAAFFPMTENRWRIVGEVPPSAYGNDEITFEEVNKDFAKLLNIKLTLHDPKWISLYHSHHRCVETFEEGRAFLLGDAAHIHSPVGAQGMNTGLQDAYNLAWKLALVIKGKASQALVQTYTEERLPFAHKLVHTTDRLFSLIVGTNPLAIFARMHIIPTVIKFVMSQPKGRKFMFRTISQIGISYRDESLAHEASQGVFAKNIPVAGDRLPYVLFTDEKGKQTNIQEFVHPAKFCLLIFGRRNTSEVEEIAREHETLMTVKQFTYTPALRELFTAFGITNGGYYLIRPDMYIAYCSNLASTGLFRKYLEKLFI